MFHNEGIIKIGEIEKLPPPPINLQRSGKGHNYKEESIVQREDAEEATGIECAEVIEGLPCVVEDAGDQESREYKKQIDAYPGRLCKPLSNPPGKTVGESDSRYCEMVDKHKQDCQAPNPIQDRNVLFLLL